MSIVARDFFFIDAWTSDLHRFEQRQFMLLGPLWEVRCFAPSVVSFLMNTATMFIRDVHGDGSERRR